MSTFLSDLADAAVSTVGDVYREAAEMMCSALCRERVSLLYDEAKVMRFKSWRGLSESYRDAAEGHS